MKNEKIIEMLHDGKIKERKTVINIDDIKTA